jgi:hypothetical protein
MRTAATAAVGLKGAFHRNSSGNLEENAKREPTILMGRVPACQRTLGVCYSRGSGRSTWNLVSSQTFPHLCKNLWKMALFGVRIAKCAHFLVTFVTP